MTYEVTIKPRWDAEGTTITITAANKAEAISKARKENAREYYYDRHDGALTYTAAKVDA